MATSAAPKRYPAPHQRAWLEAHPYRTWDWLQRIQLEGFDIHHIDGNRDNNSPDNLILVETSDHEGVIHGRLRSIAEQIQRRLDAKNKRETAGEKAYRLRKLRLSWSEIDAFLKVRASNMYARAYALSDGRPWPLEGIGRVSWERRGVVRDAVKANIHAISEIIGRDASPQEVTDWNK